MKCPVNGSPPSRCVAISSSSSSSLGTTGSFPFAEGGALGAAELVVFFFAVATFLAVGGFFCWVGDVPALKNWKVK